MTSPPKNPGKFIVDHPVLILLALAGLAGVAVASGRVANIDEAAPAFAQSAWLYTLSCLLMLLIFGVTALLGAAAFRRSSTMQSNTYSRGDTIRQRLRGMYRWDWIGGAALAAVIIARIVLSVSQTHDTWLDFHLISLILATVLLIALASCLLYEVMIAVPVCLVLAFSAAFVFDIWAKQQGFPPDPHTRTMPLPIMGWFLCSISMISAHFMIYWAMISPPGPDLLAMSVKARGEKPVESSPQKPIHKKSEQIPNTGKYPRLFAAHLVNSAVPMGLFISLASLVIIRADLSGSFGEGSIRVYELLPLIIPVALGLASYGAASFINLSCKYTKFLKRLLSHDQKRSVNSHKIVIGIARYVSPKIHTPLLLCTAVIVVTILIEMFLEVPPGTAPQNPAQDAVRPASTGLAAITAALKFCVVMMAVPTLALLLFKSFHLAAAIGSLFLVSQLLNEILISPLLPDHMITTPIANAVAKIILLFLATQISLVWHIMRTSRQGPRGAIIDSMRRFGAVYLSSLILTLISINIFVLVDSRNEIWGTSLYLRTIFGGGMILLLAPSVFSVLRGSLSRRRAV